jgi:ABC-type transporter Mla subunit MlaD
MDLESTLLVLASLVAAVLIAQTILLLVFVIAFRQWCNRTNALADQISRNVEPVLKAASELLTDSREKIASLTGNLNEISLLAKNQMTRLDVFLQDTTERAQVQVLRLDDLISDTMSRVEQTTEAIQQGVLTPVRELTAVVAGVRASLDFLFRRNRKTVERATQDEELFI